jgi:hypothetical protein
MNDGEFKNLILDALKVTSGHQIAELLRVSKPTVMRWAGGQNLPHDAVRPSVVKALQPLLRSTT